jgi:hypothetical protein
MTIRPGSKISAQGLTLTTRLAIGGNSRLGAVPNSVIQWESTLDIAFEAAGGEVPFLNLGAVSN